MLIDAHAHLTDPYFDDKLDKVVNTARKNNFVAIITNGINLEDNKKILELLKNEKNRNVIVQSVVAYHDGKKIHTFIGTVKGILSLKEKGDKGWGFDPIIIPFGENKTFAQMGPKKKNQISHRAKALEKFKNFLDSQKK